MQYRSGVELGAVVPPLVVLSDLLDLGVVVLRVLGQEPGVLPAHQ